jgi:hypothetical protein
MKILILDDEIKTNRPNQKNGNRRDEGSRGVVLRSWKFIIGGSVPFPDQQTSGNDGRWGTRTGFTLSQ